MEKFEIGSIVKLTKGKGSTYGCIGKITSYVQLKTDMKPLAKISWVLHKKYCTREEGNLFTSNHLKKVDKLTRLLYGINDE